MPRLRALLVLVASTLAIPSAAHGAAGWLPDRDLFTTASTEQALTSDVDPVFDTDGTMIVITTIHDSGQATDRLNALVRPPGGDTVATQLDDAAINSADTAVDPRGGVAVAWVAGDAIKIRRRPLGGSFGPIESVPTGLTGVVDVQMEIGPDGRETFAVEQTYTNTITSTAGYERLLTFTRSAPGQPLGAPQFITPNSTNTGNGRMGTFRLTAGPGNAAALAYIFQPNYSSSFAGELDVVRRGAAATSFVTPPQTVATTAGDPERPSVAIDSAGRATLVFTGSTAGHRQAQVAVAPAGTVAFGAPVTLTTAEVAPSYNYSFLAEAPDGSAVVGFGGGGPGGKFVARRDGPTAAFSTPQQIDMSLLNAEPPKVAMGADDVAYAILRSGTSVFHEDIDGWRSAGPGQAFKSTRVVTAGSEGNALNPGVGTDGAGNAMIVYKDSVGADGLRVLRAAPYDSVAPTVSLSGPSTLLVDAAATFGATVSDFWGPVTTSIAYDDGGNGPAHAFATAGTHTATATATDAAGLTATATATVTVTTIVAKAPVGLLDDTTPPRVTLSIAKRQKVLHGLKVKLTSNEAASAKVTLGVTVRCPHAKRAKRFALRSGSVKLAPGRVSTLTLKASKKTNGRLRKALGCRGVSAKVSLKVTARDLAGNASSLTKSVPVRRG